MDQCNAFDNVYKVKVLMNQNYNTMNILNLTFMDMTVISHKAMVFYEKRFDFSMITIITVKVNRQISTVAKLHKSLCNLRS